MSLLEMYKKLTQDEKRELIKLLIKDINEYQDKKFKDVKIKIDETSMTVDKTGICIEKKKKD